MFTRIAVVGLFRVFALSALAVFVGGSGGCGAIIRSNVETQPRVALAAADYDQPSRIVRGDAVAYAPKIADAGASDIDPDLRRFAPVIVQGFQPTDAKRKYDVDDDAIGSPNLSREGDSVRIDVSHPAVFCRVEQADVDGHALKQLVYVFWYPCRPVGSIEKGDIDGGILRLTLDAAGRPAVFEYSQPCGCFHGVFVADTLEASAAVEFPALAPNRMHAVEPPLTGEDDWVVRDLVHVSDSIADATARPILYMSAGKHFCEAMAFGPASSIGELHATRPYEMRAYDSLERLEREGGGVGSMFNERGLVLGGKRGGEELLLSDLDNPGWPRHLDRMKIDWDRAQWTDPSLIATHLRLPSRMVDARASVDVSASKGLQARSPTEDASIFAADPGTYGTLLLFTNRSCLGCMAMKRDVLPDARIKKAMSHWTLRTFDTATPDGAALAATHHVSATPTMIALDPGGRERSRSEDLLSVEEMLAAIPREPK